MVVLPYSPFHVNPLEHSKNSKFPTLQTIFLLLFVSRWCGDKVLFILGPQNILFYTGLRFPTIDLTWHQNNDRKWINTVRQSLFLQTVLIWLKIYLFPCFLFPVSNPSYPHLPLLTFLHISQGYSRVCQRVSMCGVWCPVWACRRWLFDLPWSGKFTPVDNNSEEGWSINFIHSVLWIDRVCLSSLFTFPFISSHYSGKHST